MNENPRGIGRQVIASIAAYEAAQDPAVSEWQAALGRSASEQLRDTQAALYASQQDLTRAKDELEAALHEHEHTLIQVGNLRARLGHAGEELTKVRADLDAQALLHAELRAEAAEMRTQRDRYAEQNEVLRQEITAVMRQLAGEPQPGTTKGSRRHAQCPDPNFIEE